MAQGDKKTWNTVQSAYKVRANEVKQSFIQGNISCYQSSDLRRQGYVYWKDGKTNPKIVDANSVTGFSWFTNRAEWRLDVRRIYPTIGGDFKQISYDGEKYSTYDEAFRSGSIGPTRLRSVTPPAFSNDDFTTFSSDAVFGSGILKFLQLWIGDNPDPTYRGDEDVNGESCEKFVSDNSKNGGNTVTFWFSSGKMLIMKAEAMGFKSKTKVDYVVLKAIQKNNVYLPIIAKVEIYRTNPKNNAFKWELTRIFNASKITINDSNAVSAFQNNIRVTAKVVDLLEDPGKFFTLGGETDDIVSRVEKGIVPPLEDSSVQADGAAPEVAAAQEKLEIKP